MKNEIKNGIIHVHSEYSLKDSAQSISAMINRAGELNSPAIALTDHNTLAGIEEAKTVINEYNKEHNANMKLIPGVELYYKEEINGVERRMHLIVLAKDREGYRELSKAVTDSFKQFDSKGMPYTTPEILLKYFGTGSKGHGKVIATSACMAGPISTILLSNFYLKKDIEKLEKQKLKLFNPNSPQYLKNKKELKGIMNKIEEINNEIKELTEISSRKFKKKEKALESLKKNGSEEEYIRAFNKLETEKQETESATKRIAELKDSRKEEKIKEKKKKDACKEEEKDHEKWYSLENKITALNNSIVDDAVLYEDAKKEIEKFENIFGKNNFYVELQNHRIAEEIFCMPILAKLAKETNTPVVAANDAHMSSNSADEFKARQLMRSLRFNKWDEPWESDKELYIKSDYELSSILSEIIPSDMVELSMQGIERICNQCNVEFKKESHYPVFESEIKGEDAATRLRRLSIEGIELRYPGKVGWTPEHEKRMEYELEVITKLGYCDYLCIVEDFLRYGRLIGKIDMNNPDTEYLENPYNMELLSQITKDNVGLGIGPGRGSAVGSLVCYLVGITGLDPMKYELLFERFLNIDRVSMPDIDSDFKPDIRNKVLDYVKHKYGEEAVCCIMTRGTQKAKAAIRNSARILGSEKYDDIKKFLSLGDAIAKSIPNDLKIKLSDCWDELMTKFGDNKFAVEILNNAKLIEGVFTNIGMHAAGVIIADNGDVKEYVPLLYNKDKQQWCCQCDMVQAEDLGLLKMDFLGLNNLAMITDTLRLIQKNYGKSIDIEKVPMEPDVFKNIFSTGNTNSVFQFESSGMKQMLKQFQPESINDVILLVAAYRPGPMQYLNDIIAVKHGRKKPDYVIPEMETILGNTYGYPVYQEQLMQIFNKFANFSLSESDIIRRYMSKKKTEKFMAYKDKFIDGLIDNGAQKEKAEVFWNQLVDFSKYAFNKSHATAYAFVAYYTAWLKYYYPKEYLCAVMNNTDFEKLSGLMNDCKTFGIKILPPDINTSEEKFSITGDSIVCGLGMVKNVGDGALNIISERNKCGAFTSFADFMTRTSAKKDVTESLIKSGAFDNFTKNRYALINSVPVYVDLLKKIKSKKDKISEYDTFIEVESKANYEENSKEAKKLDRKIKSKEKAVESLAALYSSLNTIAVDLNNDENKQIRLQSEKEVLGSYVSGHPLDSYKSPKELKCTPIADLTPGKFVNVMGIITDLRITKRKSDGSPMAFFKLEDRTGSVNICCFTKAFSEYEMLVVEDAVVKISGKCSQEEDNFTDEKVTQISVNSIEELAEEKPAIILCIPSIMSWADKVSEQINPFKDRNGYPLVLYDKLQGVYRKTDITVNKCIINNEFGLEAFSD